MVRRPLLPPRLLHHLRAHLREDRVQRVLEARDAAPVADLAGRAGRADLAEDAARWFRARSPF